MICLFFLDQTCHICEHFDNVLKCFSRRLFWIITCRLRCVMLCYLIYCVTFMWNVKGCDIERNNSWTGEWINCASMLDFWWSYWTSFTYNIYFSFRLKNIRNNHWKWWESCERTRPIPSLRNQNKMFIGMSPMIVTTYSMLLAGSIKVFTLHHNCHAWHMCQMFYEHSERAHHAQCELPLM